MKKMQHYLAIIIQKSVNDIIAESRRGYIGLLWWVVEPVLYMGVFYLLFVVGFKRGGEGAVAFLLIGLVVWKWFDSSIRLSTTCITVNYGLIQQVYIPKFIFPMIVVLTSTIKFLIIFVLLIIFLVVIGYTPTLSWLAIPVVIMVQLYLMLAFGGLLAATVPLLPDVRLIIENGLTLMFFMSGIFFDISSVSPKIQTYLNLNPMLGIIKNIRGILIDGLWPDWMLLGQITLIAILTSGLAWWILIKLDKSYAKII